MVPVTAPATLVVSEVFGPTFQGEGPHLGQRVGFVRLGGCNLHCVWCDTPYTWDASRHDLRHELSRRPVADLLDEIAAMGVARVVISGGEPLLWQDKPGWTDLVSGLAAMGCAVDVETNGTVEPDEWTAEAVSMFNVSPKLAHAGDPERDRIRPEVLRGFAELARWHGEAVLKIVVQTPADVGAARDLALRVGFPLRSTYVMPEGTDVATLVARHGQLYQAALDAEVNMTTRLHVLTWGEERGR